MDETRRAIYAAQLPPPRKLLLMAMFDLRDGEGRYGAGMETIAEACSIDLRDVRKHIRALETEGFLALLESGRGRGKRSVWSLTILPENRGENRGIKGGISPVFAEEDRVIPNSPELSPSYPQFPPSYPQSYPQPAIVYFARPDGERVENFSHNRELSTAPITSSISNEVTKDHDPPPPPQGGDALSGDAWLRNRLEGFRRKYPRPVHLSRRGESGACVKEVWPEVCTDDEAYEAIIGGVERWADSPRWREEDGRYIPSALTFLEGRYWEKPPTRERMGGFNPDQYRKWRDAR